MDNYASGGIGAGIIFALAIAYKIINSINHHRIKSICCGRTMSASIDIDTTTPPLKISASQ